MSKVGALLAKDGRAVVRDGFLLFLCVYGLLLAALLRILVPWIPLEYASVYLAPAAPLTASLLAGSVLGFSLVEERETRTWLLLRAAPLSLRTLALYLGGATSALALVGSALAALIYGAPVERPGLFAACLLAASLGSPLFMLFVGATAANKVEALAMYKIGGAVPATVLLLVAVPPAWLLWNPWTWIYLGLLRAQTSDAMLATLPMQPPTWLPDALFALVPAAMMLPAALLLLRRYLRVAQ
jgi:fluoroquinolone transport system permease protein